MTAPIVKLSQLTAASALTGTEAVPIVQGGVTMDIPNGTDGFVTSFGAVRNIDTDGSVVSETWVNGDVLYPHPTIAGRLTKGSHTIDLPIGFVLFAGNNGSIFVRR